MSNNSKRAPAFQLYPKDFLTSLKVQCMSVEEVGGYCLLLMNSWLADKQCHLPNDTELLRHLCRMTPEQWERHSPAILKCFKHEGNTIVNRRLLQCKENLDKYHEERKLSGKKGATKRWLSHRSAIAKPKVSHPLANAQPIANDSSSSSSSSSSPFSTTMKDEVVVDRTGVERLAEEWSQIPGVKPSLMVSSDLIEAYADRVAEKGWLELVPKALAKLRADDLLKGGNEDDFVATLDWFLRPGTVRKVCEDQYESWRKKPKTYAEKAAAARAKRAAKKEDK